MATERIRMPEGETGHIEIGNLTMSCHDLVLAAYEGDLDAIEGMVAIARLHFPLVSLEPEIMGQNWGRPHGVERWLTRFDRFMDGKNG